MQPDLFSAPPVNGVTSVSIKASRSGAQAISHTWTARQSAYLQLLEQAGALTDQEAARLLGWQLSSVNSVRGNIRQLHPNVVIEPAGIEPFTFTDASGKSRTTFRTQWRIREGKA